MTPPTAEFSVRGMESAEVAVLRIAWEARAENAAFARAILRRAVQMSGLWFAIDVGRDPRRHPAPGPPREVVKVNRRKVWGRETGEVLGEDLALGHRDFVEWAFAVLWCDVMPPRVLTRLLEPRSASEMDRETTERERLAEWHDRWMTAFEVVLGQWSWLGARDPIRYLRGAVKWEMRRQFLASKRREKVAPERQLGEVADPYATSAMVGPVSGETGALEQEYAACSAWCEVWGRSDEELRGYMDEVYRMDLAGERRNWTEAGRRLGHSAARSKVLLQRVKRRVRRRILKAA